MLSLFQRPVDVFLLEIVQEFIANIRLDIKLRFIGQRLVLWK